MNYVMSDIHGHYKWFKQMLDLIKFNDTDHLYIVGDVIDKGEDSADLFLDIINDERMTLLMGNHEKMLINSSDSPRDELVWITYNGGFETVQQFEHRGFTIDSIKPEFKKLPVEMFIEVDGKKFCLVHAKPLSDELALDKGIIYLPDTEDMNIESMVWSRIFESDEHASEIDLDRYIGKDTTLIIGHTPVQSCDYDLKYSNRIAHILNGKVINIDCGCACDYRLGCLRLEDMEEFYIPINKHDEEVLVP